MKTIQIIDNSCERYNIKSDCTCLGRRWDNLAEQLKVIKPVGEENNVCAMIVLHDNNVVDHIIVGDEPIDITSNLSQYQNIQIGFSFSNESGYIKNSEVGSFYFADAVKPTDFVPMPPQQEANLNNLIGRGFVSSAVVDGFLYFYNITGDIVSAVDLSKFVGGVSDYNELKNIPSINGIELKGNRTTEDLGIVSKESDPTVPSHVKAITQEDITGWNNKAEKDDIPSITGLATETYVNNKASSTLSESKSYADTKVANLVGSAPSTLDTLSEIATALQNNPNVVNALNNSIATKQNSTDNNLNTTSKTIVGAINEINGKISSANTQLQNILGV